MPPQSGVTSVLPKLPRPFCSITLSLGPYRLPDICASTIFKPDLPWSSQITPACQSPDAWMVLKCHGGHWNLCITYTIDLHLPLHSSYNPSGGHCIWWRVATTWRRNHGPSTRVTQPPGHPNTSPLLTHLDEPLSDFAPFFTHKSVAPQ